MKSVRFKSIALDTSVVSCGMLCKGRMVGARGQFGACSRLPSSLPGDWQQRGPVQWHVEFVDIQSLHHSTT